MKNRIAFLFVVVLMFLFCLKNVSARDLCSPNGYTIATINGIFTNEQGAEDSLNALINNIHSYSFNNQQINYQYLLNPSHLLGAGDLVDYIQQGFFDEKSDYDLVEMINSASQKITTQKVLLVAHSQGNFYANNFYDKVAAQPGGIPSQSIGVYGIATPASRVSGGGKYLTSDTDTIIASLVGGTFKRNILTPNTHIVFQKNDDGGQGHDFSKIYLKYEGNKIVSDIKDSLSKLKENDEQDSQDLCISAPELTTLHKMEGVALNSADFILNNTKNGITYVVNGVVSAGLAVSHTVGGALASVAGSLPNSVDNPIALSTDAINAFDNLPNSSSANSTETQVAKPQNTSTENTTQNNIGENVSTLPPTSIPSVIFGGSSVKSSVQNSESEQQEIGQTDTTPTDTGDESSDTPPEEDQPIVDTIPPVITLIGSDPETVITGTVYTDAGANASDDVDGDITSLITVTGSVDSSLAGTYVLTYNVSDAASNAADSVTRTVNVITPSIPLVTTTIDTNTTLLAGVYTYDNLVITNGAILTLAGDPDSADSFKGVKINAKNITIDPGSSISADAKGYGHNTGPGASIVCNPGGYSCVGASYGGISYSGDGASVIYGSATKPTDLGSGGYNYGGGAIYLEVADTFTDNGTLSADGGTASSGGSIYITAPTIAGNGILRADGGPMLGSGYFQSPGGGGRIALYYKNAYTFSGTLEAKGGCGSYDGWSKSCGGNGTVGVFDQTKNDLYLNTYAWQFLSGDAPFYFNNIYISDGEHVSGEDNVIITANNLSVDKNSTFILANNQTLDIPTITIDGGSTLALYGTETITANNLNVIGTNSTITIPAGKILSLSIPNITIDSGAFILADGKGYGQGAGPGAPVAIYDPNNQGPYYAGASYGGLGSGATSGMYGSETAPIDFGSGGNGSNAVGGGAIKISSSGILINNGTISANGGNTSSGGSIYITAGKLDGTGVFQANGGPSYCPYTCYGPGGGGRIAIYYKTSSFTGTNTASGWSGYGGASKDGTVYITDLSMPTPPPDPIPDILSSDKEIISFGFTNLTPNINGVVDTTHHTISLTVPFQTDVKNLIPAITISDKALVVPATNTVKDFTSPVTYTVTAEDNSTQDYIVTVNIAPDPNPIPVDPDAPSLVSASVTSATTVDLVFSEELDGRTITNKDFTITGHTLNVSADAFQVVKGVVRLTITDVFVMGETPEIIYNTTVSNGVKILLGAGGNTVPAKTVIATPLSPS